MPFVHLLASLSAMNGVPGSPLREGLDFSDNLYSGSPIISFFNWAFNLTTEISAKEGSKQNLSEIETTTTHYNGSTPNYPENHNADSLSIMWYLASFGTLVMFFLLISFSEVCCKKSLIMSSDVEPETSPPPYDLFAPPAYDTLYEGNKSKNCKKKKKRKCEVFVINVFGDKNPLRVPPSETVHRNDSGREPR